MWEGEGITHDFSTVWKERECDLDVGILECGADEKCIPSPTSKRGGICSKNHAELSYRELQENATSPLEVCQYLEESDGLQNCNCSMINDATGDGSAFCSYDGWCDSYTPNLCGTVSQTLYFENFTYTGHSLYCFEVGLEKGCAEFDFSGDNFDCGNAIVNGCNCSCEVLGFCETNPDILHVTGTCPNNVTLDFCDGLGSLFPNKVPVCGDEAPTSLPSLPTSPPSFPSEAMTLSLSAFWCSRSSVRWWGPCSIRALIFQWFVVVRYKIISPVLLMIDKVNY
jgi:hypothetical protein